METGYVVNRKNALRLVAGFGVGYLLTFIVFRLTRLSFDVVGALTYTYGSATIPELAWTLVGLIGLVISLMSIVDAQKNLYYLQADQRPLSVYEYAVREILAKSHLQNELIRICQHSVAVVIGVVALDTAPVNAQVPVTLLGYLIGLGLITKATLNVIGSIKDRRVRGRMIALLIQEDAARHANGNGGY